MVMDDGTTNYEAISGSNFDANHKKAEEELYPGHQQRANNSSDQIGLTDLLTDMELDDPNPNYEATSSSNFDTNDKNFPENTNFNSCTTLETPEIEDPNFFENTIVGFNKKDGEELSTINFDDF